MIERHTVRSYDDDLKALTSAVLRMGGLAEAQLADAIEALTTRDEEKARQVVSADERIDELEREVNERAIRLLALRQPMADDLRLIVAAFKISADLERIGDYCANIGKRVVALEKLPETPLTGLITQLADLASEILRETLDAFGQADLDQATDAWSRDIPLDALYDKVLRDLSTAMMEDPSLIGACTHLTFIARNIERIGDHATNIAENIYFFVSGLPLRMVKPKIAEPNLEGTEEGGLSP